MPIVPTFTNEVRAVPASAALANPGAMSVLPEAIARSGEEIGGLAAQFAQRYAEARRQSDAASFTAAASAQLGDMQFRWSRVPDREAATAGFQKEAGDYSDKLLNGIEDPLVRAHVQERISSEAAIRGLDVQNAAFGLESSARRGQLDTRLQQYAQSAASTDNDLLRAKIFDDAQADIAGSVAAGWLRPEEGAQLKIRLGSTMQEVKVRQLFNGAIDNPDQMNALVARLNDPGSFAGLNPDQREVALRRAELRADTLERRDAARLTHEDALAEKQLRQVQAANETDLLSAIYSGKGVDPHYLEQLARSQQISPAGLEAVHSAMARAEDGRDDPRTAALLWAGTSPGGTTSKDDVFAALTAGHIKTSTAGEMMRTLNERGKQRDDAVERGAFATLRTITSGQAVEQGLIKDDAVRARAEQAWSQAQGEWNRRVVAGREDPLAVLSDMAPKYASVMPAHPSWLPQPKSGAVYSLEDVKKSYGALKAARAAGTISDADLDNEARVLDAYRAFYAEAAARTAATVIPLRPGTPARKTEGTQ